jgi:cytoskeletal protein CcmA (bactofilin family)
MFMGSRQTPNLPDLYHFRGSKIMKRLFAAEQPNHVPTNQATKATLPSAQTPTRMLVVGRDITVSGEIQSCECLIVEGTVEANVSCQELRVAAGGMFKGIAHVAVADIVGGFCGDLEVSERLVVRMGGKIAATLRYHQIEIERGGEISGDIQAVAEKAEGDQRDRPTKRRA